MSAGGRKLLLAVAAAGALVLAVIVWYPCTPARHDRSDDREAAVEPVRPRDFTPTPGQAARAALADAEARARASERPTKLAPVAEAPRVIPVGPTAPPAPARTATKWIEDYRNAACACKTRSCVGDLQAGFLHTLDSTKYDEERDGQAYAQASRAAIRCYNALPEDS